MNLKEAFRYQKHLDSIMYEATSAAKSRAMNVKTVKTHHYSKADPNTPDDVEVVERDKPYSSVDIMNLVFDLIDEKYALTSAITDAKRSIGFDIDAAIERNKYRFNAVSTMRYMLNCGNNKRKETGRAFKFNIEGNQTSYVYDIDVEDTELFDRAEIKKLIKGYSAAADETSAAIDAAMVNTEVYYTPKFDVNEGLEDIMAEIMQKPVEE